MLSPLRTMVPPPRHGVTRDDQHSSMRGCALPVQAPYVTWYPFKSRTDTKFPFKPDPVLLLEAFL